MVFLWFSIAFPTSPHDVLRFVCASNFGLSCYALAPLWSDKTSPRRPASWWVLWVASGKRLQFCELENHYSPRFAWGGPHTAGLFRSVRGAKGGFPPWGLPKLRSFTSPPPWGLPKLGNFHFSPPWGLPKLGNFHFSPPWGLPKLGNFHFSPPWGLPKLGNFHFSPPWGLPKLGNFHFSPP